MQASDKTDKSLQRQPVSIVKTFFMIITLALNLQATLKQQVTRLELRGFDLSHTTPRIQGWPKLQVLQDKRTCSSSVALQLTLQLQLSKASLRSLEAYAFVLQNNLPQLLQQTGCENRFCLATAFCLKPHCRKLYSWPCPEVSSLSDIIT